MPDFLGSLVIRVILDIIGDAACRVGGVRVSVWVYCARSRCIVDFVFCGKLKCGGLDMKRGRRERV